MFLQCLNSEINFIMSNFNRRKYSVPETATYLLIETFVFGTLRLQVPVYHRYKNVSVYNYMINKSLQTFEIII